MFCSKCCFQIWISGKREKQKGGLLLPSMLAESVLYPLQTWGLMGRLHLFTELRKQPPHFQHPMAKYFSFIYFFNNNMRTRFILTTAHILLKWQQAQTLSVKFNNLKKNSRCPFFVYLAAMPDARRRELNAQWICNIGHMICVIARETLTSNPPS